MTTAPWYKSWFGKDYLDVYKHRNQALAQKETLFITKVLDISQDSKFLDIACGGGRHLHEFWKRDISVLGGDLSRTLLLNLQEKYPQLRGSVVQYDMKELPFVSKSFNAVLSLFTSFGYFETDEEHLKLLKEIRRVLRCNGKFFLDFLNAENTVKELVPHNEKQIDDMLVNEYREYDVLTKRINKRIIIERGEKRSEHLESLRAYSREEIRELLTESSFTEMRCFGDYDGSPYTSSSDRLIVLSEAA